MKIKCAVCQSAIATGVTKVKSGTTGETFPLPLCGNCTNPMANEEVFMNMFDALVRADELLSQKAARKTK